MSVSASTTNAFNSTVNTRANSPTSRTTAAATPSTKVSVSVPKDVTVVQPKFDPKKSEVFISGGIQNTVRIQTEALKI